MTNQTSNQDNQKNQQGQQNQGQNQGHSSGTQQRPPSQQQQSDTQQGGRDQQQGGPDRNEQHANSRIAGIEANAPEEEASRQKDARAATNTIWHDVAHPSRLIVPLMPKSR